MAGLAASRFSSLRDGGAEDPALSGAAPGAFELASWAFFASHVPITLLVDAQAVLPRALYEWGPRRALELYVGWSRDPLMRLPAAAWFRAIICAELALQLPFFVVALFALRGAFDARAAPPSRGLSSLAWRADAATQTNGADAANADSARKYVFIEMFASAHVPVSLFRDCRRKAQRGRRSLIYP